MFTFSLRCTRRQSDAFSHRVFSLDCHADNPEFALQESARKCYRVPGGTGRNTRFQGVRNCAGRQGKGLKPVLAGGKEDKLRTIGKSACRSHAAGASEEVMRTGPRTLVGGVTNAGGQTPHVRPIDASSLALPSTGDGRFTVHLRTRSSLGFRS
jgi:hypothetical protein